MHRITALAWKEWHENRWLVGTGLAILLGLPFIGGLQSRLAGYHHNDVMILPWVFALGGVIAILVGTTITCRDFSGDLENFWKSRPVELPHWMLVKFATGLCVVLTTCEIPLIVQAALDGWGDPRSNAAAIWFPFLLAALFGIAFLAGTVLRRIGPASMLAVAAMLLVYFLPFVFPPLEHIELSWVVDPGNDTMGRPGVRLFDPRRVPFIGVMLMIVLGSLCLSLIAARTDWRLRSGKKTVAWTIAGTVVLAMASVSYQVGTNLPLLQTIDLGEGAWVQSIRSDGRYGIIEYVRMAQPNSEEYVTTWIRTFDVTSTGIKLDKPVKRPFPWMNAWSPVRPHILFQFFREDVNEPTLAPPDGELTPPAIIHHELLTVSLDPTLANPVVHRLPLWTFTNDDKSYLSSMRIIGDRLYLLTDKTAIIDLTNPLQPRLESVLPGFLDRNYGMSHVNLVDDDVSLRLPELPGVPPFERLAMTLSWNSALDRDKYLVGYGRHGIALHQITSLNSELPRLKVVGNYEPSFLESLFGSRGYGQLSAGNGFAYVTDSARAGRLTVVSLENPRQPRTVGHFILPEPLIVSCPLPDGRVILGGRKLYLVGPPPGHR